MKNCLDTNHLAFTTALVGLFMATPLWAQETVSDALAKSKPIIDSNIRFETVDQQGFQNKAESLTLSTRIGLETPVFKGFKALIEFENVTAITEKYNSTINGKTAFPVVAEPEVTDLNRLQLTYAPNAATSFTLGRQRLLFDDQRFIALIPWRQDDQTFDAIRYDGKFGKASIIAAYVTKVNRVIADERDWESNSYLLNATYPLSEALKLQAFNYNLDFSNAPLSSTNTFGARASGVGKFGTTQWTYLMQAASQTANPNNPSRFDLYETMLQGTLTRGILTFKANYEVLEGDGKNGFIMPLSAAHIYQGFSDSFSASGGNKTHIDGIQDLNFRLILAGKTLDKAPFFKNPSLTIIHHDLKTERTNKDIGKEVDAILTFGLTSKLSCLIKYADFERASNAMPASRTKGWLMLSYKL